MRAVIFEKDDREEEVDCEESGDLSTLGRGTFVVLGHDGIKEQGPRPWEVYHDDEEEVDPRVRREAVHERIPATWHRGM